MKLFTKPDVRTRAFTQNLPFRQIQNIPTLTNHIKWSQTQQSQSNLIIPESLKNKYSRKKIFKDSHCVKIQQISSPQKVRLIKHHTSPYDQYDQYDQQNGHQGYYKHEINFDDTPIKKCHVENLFQETEMYKRLEDKVMGLQQNVYNIHKTLQQNKQTDISWKNKIEQMITKRNQRLNDYQDQIKQFTDLIVSRNQNNGSNYVMNLRQERQRHQFKPQNNQYCQRIVLGHPKREQENWVRKQEQIEINSKLVNWDSKQYNNLMFQNEENYHQQQHQTDSSFKTRQILSPFSLDQLNFK